jgi:hypothetical protein
MAIACFRKPGVWLRGRIFPLGFWWNGEGQRQSEIARKSLTHGERMVCFLLNQFFGILDCPRMSSVLTSYSRHISSKVIPPANPPRILVTGTRVPRITVFPCWSPGSIMIRSFMVYPLVLKKRSKARHCSSRASTFKPINRRVSLYRT